MADGGKKKPFRFPPNDDIILLREVIANDPYSSAEPGKKWEEIARATQLHGLSRRRCRERTSLLLSYYKKEDADALKRSGTEEEVEEKHQLLQEIKELEEEQVSRAESDHKRKEKQREIGLTIRKVALETMSKKRTSDEAQTSDSDHGPCSDPESGFTPKKVKRSSSSSDLLTYLKAKADREMSLKEQEMVLKREQLAFEKEKFELERREREKKMETESEERKMIFEFMRRQLMKNK